MKRHLHYLALNASVVVAVACMHRDAAPADPVTLGKLTTVSATTGVGTSPTFAVAANGDRALVWISAPDSGVNGRLYVSVNDAPPSMIVDPLAPIEAHSEAPPRIMFAPDGSLNVLYIVGKDVGQRFPVSALRFIRSQDRGRTWSAPVTVTDDSVEFGAHNFHSLYVAPDGALYAAWLDGRSGKSATYFTYSTDGGRTWARNTQLSVGETCPCCRTAITADANGVVYAAWRTVLAGNVRDIVVARSGDHGATWSAPARVHADDWVFTGCPHAGPSIQTDSAGRLHVLWWTGAPNNPGVFYTVSLDGGKTFGVAETMYSQTVAVPSHVQLALNGSRVVATWDEMSAHGALVSLRTSRDGGATFGPSVTVSDTASAAQYPVVGLSGANAYVAWSQTDARGVTSMGEMHGMAEHTGASPGGEPRKMGLHPVGATQVFMREVRL